MLVSKRNLVLQVLNKNRGTFFSVSEIQEKIKESGEHIHVETVRRALQEFGQNDFGFVLSEKKRKMAVTPYHKKIYSICGD